MDPAEELHAAPADPPPAPADALPAPADALPAGDSSDGEESVKGAAAADEYCTTEDGDDDASAAIAAGAEAQDEAQAEAQAQDETGANDERLFLSKRLAPATPPTMLLVIDDVILHVFEVFGDCPPLLHMLFCMLGVRQKDIIATRTRLPDGAPMKEVCFHPPPCLALPCLVVPCLALSCRALSCLALSWI
jgi:hypothetical protein